MNLFYGNCSVLSFGDIIEKLFILLQMNKYSDIITLWDGCYLIGPFMMDECETETSHG